MQEHRTARRRAAIGIVVALALGAPASAAEAQPPLVAGVHGIATGIAACWRPPHDNDQVTVRLSFTREGAVIDEPRIVFVHSSGGGAGDSALAQSMLKAIRACTPLHFSARAWLGDRGPGSGHSLHRPQPGDHRRPAVTNLERVLPLRRALPNSFEIALINSPDFRVSRRCSEDRRRLKHARRAEARCLGG